MEQELASIDAKFKPGKYKQAIDEMQALIEKFSTDNGIFKAYDLLGTYFNFMGQHVKAVEAWTKALKSLEDNAGGIDKLHDEQLDDWIHISLKAVRIFRRENMDRSGESHKHNNESHTTPKLNENEETKLIKEKLDTVIKLYKRVIDKMTDNSSAKKKQIQTELASVLFDVGNFDEATKIYQDAFNDDGDSEWLYKTADCLWRQGKREEAFLTLQQLIETEPSFAKAYKLCGTYFTEINETARADECEQRYKFYSWIPGFCHYIEYNPENMTILETIQSKDITKCIETTLAMDPSKRATEFLAAICYHHFHGLAEDKAFEELEKRAINFQGDEKDFVGSILIYLIRKNQSICTVKGAANALAGMKHEQAFEILKYLLPDDIDLLYPMHIPKALAKLGDPQAIPLLIKVIEEPIHVENADSDSSGEFLTSGGSSRLVSESCLALSTFFNDPKVKDVFLNGINNQEIRETCLAVLAVCTGENQFWDKLQNSLSEGNTLDDRIVKYLKENTNQSQQADELLKLNQQMQIKKQMNNQSDDD